MIYNPKTGKIRISMKEFISIARRGISATMPFDEDDPSIKDSPAHFVRETNIPEIRHERMIYGFVAMGYHFELDFYLYHFDGYQTIIAKELPGSPRTMSKDERELVRAEAYIASKVLYDKWQLTMDRISVRYCLHNVLTDEFFDKYEHLPYTDLNKFFDKCTEAITKFAAPEVERVTQRKPSFSEMRFPYPKVRDGQRDFIKRAYRDLCLGKTLFAEAPTGTGKTVSVLYPALKAIGKGRAEKIFYLTPKGTTADAARDTIDDLVGSGAKIKAIILTRKEAMCQGGGICRSNIGLCRYSSCKNIAEAVLKLYENAKNCLDYKDVIEVAREFAICPYELSLAYSEIADIVICDFNYLFDPSVYLRRFFDEGGRYIFLVDEAHNLVDRSREMYSASITIDEIKEPYTSEQFRGKLNIKPESKLAAKETYSILYPYIKDELRETKDGKIVGATHLSQVPEKLFHIFETLSFHITEELKGATRAKDFELCRLLREYRARVQKFTKALLRFDKNYKLIIFFEAGKMSLRILAMHTANELRKMTEKGHATLYFSATLSPLHYYRAALGSEGSDDCISVESPFAKEQLSVNIMDKISTRFSEREDTLAAVCRVIAATVSAKRGNYMIFSPSHSYSRALHRAFTEKYPKIKTLLQKSDMSAEEKREFIEKFKEDDSSYLIGFAVMGGIYAEGIDLSGDSLIGAVIVGIGLPGLSYEREAIAEFYEERYEEGKQFAYIYPGMNRVFQAAGRVIRREEDRGVIVLIDDRFDDPLYKKSLPKLWSNVKFIPDAKILREELDKFWHDLDEEKQN